MAMCVEEVAGQKSAGEGDLVFVEDDKGLAEAMESRAAAVIAGESAGPQNSDKPLLIVSHPRLAFARAAEFLRAGKSHTAGIHPSAVIASSARVASSAAIEAHVVIGEAAEVVEPYRAGLAGRVAITVQASSDLPMAFIDRTLFARALTNVIENALHAMPGGGTLTITSREERLPEHVLVVEVTDTGMGMDAAARARIFEPYFSTKATGTGLGLTIAKRNVELNGGTIAVASERGVGTTVTMTLPLSELRTQNLELRT